MANRPDTIIHDKEEQLCLIIDIAFPDDLNVIQKEAEKVHKYRDLQIEVQRMWSAKTCVIPVVIGALGTMTLEEKQELRRNIRQSISTSAPEGGLTQNCRNPEENTKLNHFGFWQGPGFYRNQF